MVKKTRKHKLKLKVKSTRNLYKHDLYSNSYIVNSFDKMMKGNSKEEKINYLYYLMRYCFADISISKCKEITESLYLYIENKATDREISNTIYDFVKHLKSSNIEGFPITNEEYVKTKIHEIESTITSPHYKKQKGKILVDVGAGDCAISKALGDDNSMQPIAIDIESNIDWGSVSGSSACDKVTHVYYDGNDLISGVRNVIGNSPVGIIMYNHSLHHFGSYENIKKSLEQAYTLLDNNGVLFVREHDASKASDIDINLQHIFLSLRYTIEHYNDWNKNQLSTYMENYVKTYSAHFLISRDFIKLCRLVGFKLIKARQRKISYHMKNFKDISMTTLFSFKK